MAKIPHSRAAIVDITTGRATRVFYELLANVAVADTTFSGSIVTANDLAIFPVESNEPRELGFIPLQAPAAAEGMDTIGLVHIQEPTSAAEGADAIGLVPIQEPIPSAVGTAPHMPVVLADGRLLYSTSIDITTSGNNVIICLAALTVTLNDSPADGEMVTVKATTPTVVVDGNGRTIDDDTEHNMVIANDGVNIVYVAATDKWYLI